MYPPQLQMSVRGLPVWSEYGFALGRRAFHHCGALSCSEGLFACLARGRANMITFVRNCADVLECVSRDFLGQSGEKSNQTKRP
jgi:hypothetical protein